MKFCPFRSNEKEIECSENCALYIERVKACAFQNLGEKIDYIDKDLEDTNIQLYEISQRV